MNQARQVPLGLRVSTVFLVPKVTRCFIWSGSRDRLAVPAAIIFKNAALAAQITAAEAPSQATRLKSSARRQKLIDGEQSDIRGSSHI